MADAKDAGVEVSTARLSVTATLELDGVAVVRRVVVGAEEVVREEDEVVAAADELDEAVELGMLDVSTSRPLVLTLAEETTMVLEPMATVLCAPVALVALLAAALLPAALLVAALPLLLSPE